MEIRNLIRFGMIVLVTIIASSSVLGFNILNIFNPLASQGFDYILSDNQSGSNWTADNFCFSDGPCFNETNKYLNLSGTNADQDINIDPYDFKAKNINVTNNLTVNNSINQNNYSIKPIPSNSFIRDELFSIWMDGPTGVNLPHFVIQGGGSTQASYIMRSIMIVDEIPGFFNDTNRTSCLEYMGEIGEELKIDCNTTTSGADLLVSDDLQVVGDVWQKDVGGEWHFMSKELDSLDSLQSDTLQGNVTFSFTLTNLTVYNKNTDMFTINIDGENFYLEGNQTSNYESGTNDTPALGYLQFIKSGGTAVLDNTPAYPTVSHVDIGVAVVGELGNFYYAAFVPTSTEKAIYKLYDQARNSFNQYISGFSPEVTSTTLNFTTGEYWDTLTEIDSTTDLGINKDGFYLVLNNGTFVQCVDLSCITQYNDGGNIAANAYVNVLFGVIPTSGTLSRIVAIVQNEPTSTYVTVNAAELDKYSTITNTINHPEITLHKMLLVRTIVSNSGDNFQLFANGLYYENILSLAAAGAAAGGTNDHSLLTNLDYASAAHTGFASSVQLSSIGNWTKDKYNATRINWSRILNNTFPAECPEGSAITKLNNSVTCTAFDTNNWNNTPVNFTQTNIKGNLTLNGSSISSWSDVNISSYTELDEYSTNTSYNVTINASYSFVYNITDPSLIGLWALNGTPNNELGTNNGVENNFDGDEYSLSYGLIEQGVNLGVNDYIQTTDTQSFDRTDGYLVSVWFNTTTTLSGYPTIIAFRTGDNADPCLMYFDNSGNSKITIGSYNGATGFSVVTPTGLNDGVWHHLVMNHFSNSSFDAWLDGNNIGNSGLETGSTASNQAIQIGADTGIGRYFTGSIDEVRVYNRSFLASEIQNLYALGSYHNNTVTGPAYNETRYFNSTFTFNDTVVYAKDFIVQSRIYDGDALAELDGIKLKTKKTDTGYSDIDYKDGVLKDKLGFSFVFKVLIQISDKLDVIIEKQTDIESRLTKLEDDLISGTI